MRARSSSAFRRRLLVLPTLLCLVVVAPAAGDERERAPTGATRSGASLIPGAAPIPDSWRAALNYFRSQADLPPVRASDRLSKGDRKHARYMVENQRFTHYEEPGLPFYSRIGDLAGRNSNLLASHIKLNEGEGVTSWINQPFHALGMLEPALRRSGYGAYFERNGPSKYDFAAALDVSSGLGTVPDSVNYPVMYPKPGATTYLRAYSGNEFPDPLQGCGFGAPTGAPIYLLQKRNHDLKAHSLRVNGEGVRHCAYGNREFPGEAGKRSLKFHRAIVVIPRHPLASEAEYEVSITTDAATTSWQFETPDFIPPTSSITDPADEDDPNARAVPASDVDFAGTASADAVAVDIALLQAFQNGECRWWNGDDFVSGGCGKYVWVRADGVQNWSYTLSEPLTPTGYFYFLYSRATDDAGNREPPRSDDDSEVVFYVWEDAP